MSSGIACYPTNPEWPMIVRLRYNRCQGGASLIGGRVFLIGINNSMPRVISLRIEFLS